MNAGWNSNIQTEFDIDGNEMLIVDGNADDDEKELVLVQTSVSSNRLPPLGLITLPMALILPPILIMMKTEMMMNMMSMKILVNN